MNSPWIKLAACLLLGFVLGAGAATFYWDDGQWRGGKDRYGRMLEEFGRRLDLTEEQSRQIEAILEEKRKKISALRAEIRPRFDEIRRAVREDIRTVLKPRQIEEFDAIQDEWEERRRKRREKRG